MGILEIASHIALTSISTIPWLAFPHEPESSPNEAIARKHSFCFQWDF